jgi:hypothetical protein
MIFMLVSIKRRAILKLTDSQIGATPQGRFSGAE